MGWIGCVCCKKFRRDFVLRTFALVRPVLHSVSKANQTIPNAPKQYKRHQNITLGCNGIGCVRCEKFRCDFVETKFLHQFGPFCTEFHKANNCPKYTQIVLNAPKHEFGVQWGGTGEFVVKNSDVTFCYELLHQFSPFCSEFRKATKRSQMRPNSMKRTKT